MRSRNLFVCAGILALASPVVAQADLLSGAGQSVPQRAELYSLTQVESIWHRSTSKKNVDLMMSLWAPGATLSLGGKTVKGKPAIRLVMEGAGPFQKANHWISETPAYKLRATVIGNKGTLYFECHYIDVDTNKVTLVNGISADLKKVNGKWLITKVVGSSPSLTP